MPNNETIERIQQIRERLAKATPGPWHWRENDSHEKRALVVSDKMPDGNMPAGGAGKYGGWVICETRHRSQEKHSVLWPHPFGENGENDGELIAHAPSDIEYLLSALSEMRTIALREAAEIDLASDIQGITDWGKGYKQGVRDYAAAILGRIDK